MTESSQSPMETKSATDSSKSPKQVLLEGTRFRSLAWCANGAFIILSLLALVSDAPLVVSLLPCLLTIVLVPALIFDGFSATGKRLQHLLENPDQITWICRHSFPIGFPENMPNPWRIVLDKVPFKSVSFEIRALEGSRIWSCIPLARVEEVTAWLHEIAPKAFSSSAPIAPSPASGDGSGEAEPPPSVAPPPAP